MTKSFSSVLAVVAALALVACGPGPRQSDDDDDDDGPDAAVVTCIPSAQTESSCNDGFDNDCNGYLDCEDTACIGTPECPIETCEITTPSVSFALPDGNCTGIAPSPGAPDSEFEAFLATCGAYDGVMNLSGFPAGARLEDPSKFLGVCAKMEHSWLRDMQMELYCPDGTRVLLDKFRGQDCPSGACEVYLGEANDSDSSSTPIPGLGWDYCWATAATNPQMLDVANAAVSPPFPDHYKLPAGDYQPSQPFSGLAGCSLNGEWKIRIVDGWGIDNGFVFETKLMFDPSLSDDCPIIE